MKRVTNWGNTPSITANVIPFHRIKQLQEAFRNTGAVISRGMGRCYGDSALNRTIVSTVDFNHIESFDIEKGIVVCQAGITLDAILRVIVPKGWFLPVTPGTKFVTLGGAVAANVHGKNHHKEGSLAHHLLYMDVMTSNGNRIRCSKHDNVELFYATCGGMGLTGVVVEVAMQLRPIDTAFIRQKTYRAKHLEEIMTLFESHQDWTYSVAWIDCLAKGDAMGRSVLMLGEHASQEELTPKYRTTCLELPTKRRKKVPFFVPSFVLNAFTVRLFNFFYYFFSPKSESITLVDYDTFFYPLDHIHDWNKGYGKRGFTQYQCVLPLEGSKEGLSELLTLISESGQGSFLAVLKRFGKESLPGLSFPMEGYTLALDFPMSKKALDLMEKLDVVVQRYHGRLYLAKDSRMSEKVFKATYSEYDAFKVLLQDIDADNKFVSLQSKRLNIK